MALLGTFTQQPADRLDYDIDYNKAESPFLSEDDSVASAVCVVTPATGLTIEAPVVVDGTVVKLWVTDGTAGTYKAEVTMTTTLGRVKQDEIRFVIKDY